MLYYTSVNAKTHIPACPDLVSLPNDINNLNTDQLSKLKCFCSGGDEENLGMNVNCIFGSKLEDLMEALNAIDDVNGTIFRISLDHIEIIEGEDGITLEEALSSGSLIDLKEFEIKECRGGALVEHRENQIVEFPHFPKLESIIIENCDLETIPTIFLSKTPILRYLSLMGNKINEIKRDDLTDISNTVCSFFS
uniref:Uncharacterized protein n=1 Tax=Panagrolaimus superbus TaxID=310955 RepID=A0A914YCA9_9BILA